MKSCPVIRWLALLNDGILNLADTVYLADTAVFGTKTLQYVPSGRHVYGGKPHHIQQ